MSYNKAKQILIAPLDWGLGHTTRCVPLIGHLRSLGHSVLLAGNDWQRSFITETFPGIETIHLDGYNVTYSKKASGFMLSVFTQLPRLLKTIRKEHDWLMELTAKKSFDGIISDNRYGLSHPHIPTAFMTHQLQAQSGLGSTTDSILRKLHYRHINRFNDCWVIDLKGIPNLGGSLSHPAKLPPNSNYMGLLSQVADASDVASGAQHLMILLSGPEPQRSLLSGILWKQALKYPGKLIFIEGSSTAKRPGSIPHHISYHSRVIQSELVPLLNNASMVICRSGYSTLMDLVAFGKKAILIPTPGQTEQEYLGKYLSKEGIFYSAPQKNFNLTKNLALAERFPFRKLPLGDPFHQYQNILDQWVAKL